MLPVRDDKLELKEVHDIIPTKTYKMHLSKEKIYGYADEQKATEQAIYKILKTERYKYPIYSWDYGIELEDLFGKPKLYCKSTIPERIKEALLVDKRIESLDSFEFEDSGREGLICKFIARTIYGDVEIAKGVRV